MSPQLHKPRTPSRSDYGGSRIPASPILLVKLVVNHGKLLNAHFELEVGKAADRIILRQFRNTLNRGPEEDSASSIRQRDAICYRFHKTLQTLTQTL